MQPLRNRLGFTAILLALLLAHGVGAQRDLKDIPDPDPELERKSFEVAEGFEVNLFASDPLLAKPIQMNFDPQGRLWVASSQSYPQLQPGEVANDKILILEDKNGDGKADKTTVYADGLLMPTGLEPGDGGVYVANSTELMHLSSPDDSGKAQKRRVVLSGFGTEDTHHIIHTFRWAPDGALYFNQSIYIHSHVETPHGVRHLNAGGIWQFRPDSYRLNVFARGWYNAWGHTIDTFGQSFVTDGAGGEGVNYVIPGAYYPSAQGAKRIFHGLNPGSPKYCGAELLSGRHLPESWQGNLLTNDFRGHRVCRFVLVPDGAGYAARQQADLIRTKHAAFRPIDIKMGPDGAIYIADWYNPIIQHGEVPFRDPRRDRTHGRIWRVTAKGRPLVPRPQLVDASTETLLDALKAPEKWTRRQAGRVLQERGKSIVSTLAKWVEAQDDELIQLRGLWVYQSLDIVNEPLLRKLLDANEPRIRAAAVRVLSAWHPRVKGTQSLLAARVRDEYPQVRLEAVRALAELREPRSIELALNVLDKRMDPFLDYALWLTLQELEPIWLPALQAGKLDFGGKTQRLAYALEASGSREVVPALIRVVKSGKLDSAGEVNLLTLLAEVGSPRELSFVLERTLQADRWSASQKAALLGAMERASRLRKMRPSNGAEVVLPLTKSEPEAEQVLALRLAGLWKLDAVRPQLETIVAESKSSAAQRQAAIDSLVSLGGDESKAFLRELIADKRELLACRSEALVGLSRLDSSLAANLAPGLLAEFSDASQTSGVFGAFLQQKRGPAVLASNLKGKTLPADVAKVGLRIAKSQGRPFTPLIDALQKAGKLTTMSKPTEAEIRALVDDVTKLGDARRGEAVYRRADLSCQKCHAIGGAGGQVGPDLSTIGGSAQVDYLVESLLLPNKAIKENYHSVVVATADGQVFTGVKVRQNKDELVLRTAEDKEVVIATKNIEEQSAGASLMPEGLVAPLTRGELLDLVRFLSELGKVGPYAVSQAPVVRRWEALVNNKDSAFILRRRGFIGATHTDTPVLWTPAYSTVGGSLPLWGLPRMQVRKPISKETIPMCFVRCQLDVTTAGTVAIHLDSIDGLRLWLDQTPVDITEKTVLELAKGVRTLTFAIALDDRKVPLRCEVRPPTDSTARVRIVGGK